MSNSNRSRLASLVIAIVLIVSAFIAILSASSLAWPLGQSLAGEKTTNPASLPGQLFVSANLTKYYGFTVNGSALTASQSTQPMQGVNVTIFSLNQPNVPLFSEQTNSLGVSVISLNPGQYSAHLAMFYSNLSVQVSIISNQTTRLSVSINGTQHIASFYDLEDMDSIGQVLSSENVYMELDGSQNQINSSIPSYLATYGGSFFPILCYWPCPTNLSSFTSVGFSQYQEVPSTIVSMTIYNSSIWIEARPNFSLNIFAIKYLGLEQFSTTYSISNSSFGGPTPILA